MCSSPYKSTYQKPPIIKQPSVNSSRFLTCPWWISDNGVRRHLPYHHHHSTFRRLSMRLHDFDNPTVSECEPRQQCLQPHEDLRWRGRRRVIRDEDSVEFPWGQGWPGPGSRAGSEGSQPVRWDNVLICGLIGCLFRESLFWFMIEDSEIRRLRNFVG